MSDFRDLKAIAEVCQQHQPLRFMRSHGALYIRNDNGIVFDVHQNRSFPEFMGQNKDYADLVLAANPATILALIAENERLERLALDSVNAEYAGSMDIESICAERDQLKAENEALRTKLEKPDPILIQCMDTAIVEQDQLEKDAARYRWLREDRSGYVEVVEWIGPHATGMTGEDLDALLDAAMGKGEQS